MSNRYSIIEIAEAVRQESAQKLTIQIKSADKNEDISKSDEKEKTKETIERVEAPEKEKDNFQENQRGNDFPADYSSFEEQFFQQYTLLGFEKRTLSLYSLDDREKDLEEFYKKIEFSDTGKETLDDKEARETVQEALYEATTNSQEMDMNTRKRFNMWQQFNKALLFLYDKNSLAQTSNVNYGRDC